MDKQLIHIHIPKTGGWSLQNTLIDYGVLNFQHEHKYATEIIDDIGLESFNNGFKFTIVRNPWARLLSSYTFVTKGSDVRQNHGGYKPPEYVIFDRLGVKSFNDFIYKLRDINQNKDDVYITTKGNEGLTSLEKDSNGLTMNQTKWVLDENSNRLVDYVGYLHKLEESIDELNKLTGLNIPIPPKGNVTKHVKYTEAYTPETRDIVAKLYEKDIKEFNFVFGE